MTANAICRLASACRSRRPAWDLLTLPSKLTHICFSWSTIISHLDKLSRCPPLAVLAPSLAFHLAQSQQWMIETRRISTGPMAALQRQRQELRIAIPTNLLVISAVCARYVAIASIPNVPIARKPRSPAASLIKENESTIRRSCK